MSLNRRAEALAARRASLIARVHLQRDGVARLGQDIAQSLGWVDSALAGLRWLRRHPIAAALPAALLAAWRPKHGGVPARAGGILLAAWRAWRLLRPPASPR